MRELEVGDRGLEAGVGQRARDVQRQLAVRARGQVARAELSRNSRWSRKASSLVVSPPAIAAVRAPAFFSAPPAAASAFSHEAGISSVPSRTSGSTIRSSECTCW